MSKKKRLSEPTVEEGLNDMSDGVADMQALEQDVNADLADDMRRMRAAEDPQSGDTNNPMIVAKEPGDFDPLAMTSDEMARAIQDTHDILDRTQGHPAVRRARLSMPPLPSPGIHDMDDVM